jgi:hypothetical protein
MTKAALTIEAYVRLIAHDIFMSRRNFAALHQRVKQFPARVKTATAVPGVAVSSALDLACCFYPRRVLCLQRSAVLTMMLRSRGLPAHMVIGAQKLPFKAHAWVVLDGDVLGDRLATQEKFLIVEIC